MKGGMESDASDRAKSNPLAKVDGAGMWGYDSGDASERETIDVDDPTKERLKSWRCGGV